MNYAQVVRKYFAAKLQTDIAKDGQVPGFANWFRDAKPEEKRRAFDELLVECKAAGVEAEPAPETWLPEDVHPHAPAYMAMRLALLKDIETQHLRPFEVAAYLELQRSAFPQIDPREIAIYKRMGEVWEPWRGYDAEYGQGIAPGTPRWNPETQRIEPWPHESHA